MADCSAVVVHALVTVAKAAARSDRVDTELLPLIMEQVRGWVRFGHWLGVLRADEGRWPGGTA